MTAARGDGEASFGPRTANLSGLVGCSFHPDYGIAFAVENSVARRDNTCPQGANEYSGVSDVFAVKNVGE